MGKTFAAAKFLMTTERVLPYETVNILVNAPSFCGRVLQFPSVQRKPKKNKQIILLQSDVQSLYPGRGLSDVVLDFFLW